MAARRRAAASVAEMCSQRGFVYVLIELFRLVHFEFLKMANSVPRVLDRSFIKNIREGSKSLRELKKVNPRERYVLLHPNSDRARPGMAFKILNVRPAEEVFERASEIVKKDLLQMCLQRPAEELESSLENRNIATFVTTEAFMAKLAHERPEVIPISKAAGGIGIGFVNSLVFSKAMSFENGLDLVRRLGQSMDRAAELVPSAKVKVHVLPATSLHLVCKAAAEHCVKLGIPSEIAVCQVTQKVRAHLVEIGGHEEAIKYLEREGERLFRFRICKRVDRIPKAYHTHLMRPAQEFIEGYIKQRQEDDPDYLKEPETCSVYSAIAGQRLRGIRYIVRDLSNFPVKTIKIEQLLTCLFNRPQGLAYPNTLVLYDRQLLKDLEYVNRKARSFAKLYS